MAEKNMPAAEVEPRDPVAYELAYHVLPTVAEGEVVGVTDAIKKLISEFEGAITDEEAAKRFDLAYDIIQNVEGKNRKFSSAYFGWIRFSMDPAKVTDLTEEVDHEANVLRTLLVKLTRDQEAFPFRFHEALEATMVETVDADAAPEAEKAPEAAEPEAEKAADKDAETPETDTIEK